MCLIFLECSKKLDSHYVHIAVWCVHIMSLILFAVQHASSTGHGRSKKCSVHRMHLKQQRTLARLMRLSFGRTAARICLESARSWTTQASNASLMFWTWQSHRMWRRFSDWQARSRLDRWVSFSIMMVGWWKWCHPEEPLPGNLCKRLYLCCETELPVSSLFAARWYWIVSCVTVTCCFLAKSFSSGLQRYPHGFFFFSTFVFNQFLSFFFFSISFLSLTPLIFFFFWVGGWGGGGPWMLHFLLFITATIHTTMKAWKWKKKMINIPCWETDDEQ